MGESNVGSTITRLEFQQAMYRINFTINDHKEITASKSSLKSTGIPLIVTEGFLYLLTVLFHSGGLYLLLKVKKNQSDNMAAYTHKRLLVLLSSNELFYGIGRIINCVRILTEFDGGVIFDKFIYSIMSISGALGFSAVNFITINRLLSTVYPHWYRQYMTKGKFMSVVVCVMLLFGSVTTVVVIQGDTLTKTKFVSSVPMYIRGRLTICIPLILYFIFCIFAYRAIFNTLLKSQRTTNNENSENPTTPFQQILEIVRSKGCITPFLITLTYAVFVAIPYIGELIILSTGGVSGIYWSWNKVLVIIWSLNNVSDALINVFCDGDIRNHMREKLRRNCIQDSPQNIHTLAPPV